MYSIITKFYKWPVRSQCVQMYTLATKNHVCEHDEQMYAVISVHAYVEHVSYETCILL